MSRKEPNTLIALSSSTWDEEELRVAKRVLDSGNLSMGKEVAEFEETFAATVGSRFAVMFNSGSSANLGLFFALKYGKDINLKQSSEVIVPAVSWSTSFYPISQAGFKLRFVDVNHKTLNIDPDKVLENINDKTGAILAVNLLGNPSELSILRDIAESKNIILLEDSRNIFFLFQPPYLHNGRGYGCNGLSRIATGNAINSSSWLDKGFAG
jgi:CDP-6-deoxy-D-xylo-4-hexulose-3-dehydrase